ncbi:MULTISPECIES: aminotransferase class I/II-fold pyridoxal phosphate-dependent enzyme [Streptomyces]|uniref:aminotransferase class I/II-fold pyridoxal phosphate-dependent enzyme n=1 Tax=Streptomyces TaxID=1883 RepID=UPI001E372552|nr:aminotransferase class I/II-fold pyridoxal phosphate-dependent enzyme [Streptomyces sp. 8ZJF_21]MCC4321346.1 aminotransferase class I/II-fold pyridoxal phosphate-dependent enzyme [Streptomyces malaysiensis]MCD9591249.1 aminotransferase class I/II-fold pyridoxal phosphate-dependent enzyme [Streptomyces sp. 8ZJF_21]
MNVPITGTTAGEIAASVRDLVDRGELGDGEQLPPARSLAGLLGVNRNTVISAYRQLVQAGVAVTRGRGGTWITSPSPFAMEGFAPDTVLRDVGNGNPHPDLLPELSTALASVSATPVLYGQDVLEPGLAEWANRWLSEDQSRDFRLVVSAGAVDGVERLLAQALTYGDAVGLEDPCFLTSVHTARTSGYRAVPIPVDDEGMTVAGLRAALNDGVRAVVCTPRAHNPTGTSMSADRAAELRDVLADHPYVLLIEDDHFSMLSTCDYNTIVGEGHQRWALVRSVSKFLGPDLRMAFIAADAETAARLAARLNPGTTWVSHLLQRLALHQLSDPAAQRQIAHARTEYARRNAAFSGQLAARGIPSKSDDGLNVWVDVNGTARDVAERLMRRGWLARTGDEFSLALAEVASRHLRLTIHDLDPSALSTLADDLAAAITAAP